MPDRNEQKERGVSADYPNAKDPKEIDKAPAQDIQHASVESQKGKKVDADPSKESDRPIEQ